MQSPMNTFYINSATQAQKQLPWPVRALWYIFIGFWATGLWVAFAYLFCLLIVTLPLSTWMFDRVNTVLTLKRIN